MSLFFKKLLLCLILNFCDSVLLLSNFKISQLYIINYTELIIKKLYIESLLGISIKRLI